MRFKHKFMVVVVVGVLSFLVIVFVASMVLVICVAKFNIVQTVVAAGQFKMLVKLVKQAGLAGTLQGKGSFTVFVPTDAAFAKVPKSTLAALAKDKAKLRVVLFYHVAKGKLTVVKVVKLRSIKTLNG